MAACSIRLGCVAMPCQQLPRVQLCIVMELQDSSSGRRRNSTVNGVAQSVHAGDCSHQHSSALLQCYSALALQRALIRQMLIIRRCLCLGNGDLGTAAARTTLLPDGSRPADDTFEVHDSTAGDSIRDHWLRAAGWAAAGWLIYILDMARLALRCP